MGNWVSGMNISGVKIRFISGSMFIEEVYINDSRPYRFMLSTDTTNTCIDKKLATEPGLKADKIGSGIGLGGEVIVEKNILSKS